MVATCKCSADGDIRRKGDVAFADTWRAIELIKVDAGQGSRSLFADCSKSIRVLVLLHKSFCRFRPGCLVDAVDADRRHALAGPGAPIGHEGGSLHMMDVICVIDKVPLRAGVISAIIGIVGR